MTKATEAFTAGDFDNAISICEKAVKDEELDAKLKTQFEALCDKAEKAKAAAEKVGEGITLPGS